MSAAKLRLGPLPTSEVVKLTVTMPADLKVQLDAYAEVYSRMHAPVDATMLIPHMLAAFIARDRGFKAMRNAALLASRTAGSHVSSSSASQPGPSETP